MINAEGLLALDIPTFVFTFGDLAIYQETGKLLIVPIEKIN